MKKLGFILFLFVMVACGRFGSKKRPHQERPQLPPPASGGCLVKQGATIFGGSAAQSIQVNGTKRTYILSIPKAYDYTKTHSLIISWHGLGLSGDQMQKDFVFALEEKAQGSAIFVYPDAAINGMKRSLDPSGNGPDVAFFDSLVKSVASSFCVDTSKIYSIGFSNGAFFTNALAQVRPNVLRGIVPIAGGGGGGVPTPALVVHSKDDSSVGIGNGFGSVKAWAEAAGCEQENYSSYPLGACTPLKGCKTAPVGFCYWGQTKPGQGTHDWPRFPKANDDIWSFLSQP